MAKNTSLRRTHSAPGVYFTEQDLTYATKSLGNTSLGLVGETEKGPAFQKIKVSKWDEYVKYFGGKNPQKFKGSQYPKYELPYIASEYLKESDSLQVVRVLGLSGVNAGPAWVLSAFKADNTNNSPYTKEKPIVIGILRSRGEHKKAALVREKNPDAGICEDEYAYDEIEYFAKDVLIGKSDSLFLDDKCNPGFSKQTGTITISANNYGTFTLYVKVAGGDYKKYAISLNPGDKNYIYNVLGGDPETGDAELFVEEFYDIALQQLVEKGLVDSLFSFTDSSMAKMSVVNITDTLTATNILAENLTTPRELKTDVFPYQIKIDNSFVNISETHNGYVCKNSQNKFFYCYNGKLVAIDTDTVYVISGKNYKFTINEGTISKSAYAPSLEDDGPIVNADGTVVGFGSSLHEFSNIKVVPRYEAVLDMLTIEESQLTRRDVGKRYLFSETDSIDSIGSKLFIHTTSDNGRTWTSEPGKVGHIYTVVTSVDDEGQRHYYYGEYAGQEEVLTPYSTAISQEDGDVKNYSTYSEVVEVASDGVYYMHVFNETPTNVDLSLHGYFSKATHEFVPREDDWYSCSGIVNVIGYSKIEFSARSSSGESTSGVSYPDSMQMCFFDKDKRVIPSLDIMVNDGITRTIDLTTAEYKNVHYVALSTLNHGWQNPYLKLYEDMLVPITLDMNNYKDSYRYASTPWIVSEFKGSANEVELTKLFRFHTISDGASANTEVKVSIENIDPTYGTFDVVVRNFYDNDTAISVVEKFSKCNLVPGTSNYIALKIGSLDGVYSSKSDYITVEMNEESDKVANSIPCGFMGYPTRDFNGNGVYSETKPMFNPYLAYNTTVDDTLHVRKQYFGMSDLMGIDEDILKYKGSEAYNGLPSGMSPCFHLDSRIFNGKPNKDGIVLENGISQRVTIDGIDGYTWSTVSKSAVTSENIQPQISTEADLRGTIYEDKRFRKFTVCFYGGWDGWDYYRTSRSNSDEFTYKNYRGRINHSGSGEGANFSVIRNPEGLEFEDNTKLITSDYYAYLGAIRQFSNRNTSYINVLATPGIDYVNQKQLVTEVANMIEDEEDRNKDCIYIVTTPDKPFGAGDDVLSMYTPLDAVINLEDSELNSSCIASYYPWVKYYDQNNSQYIFLPATKDVVRAIAYTDRIAQPWYAAAGWNRGDINAEGPRKKLKNNEQDKLYEGRLNFIYSFAEEETDKLWGDKNFQIADTITNRLSKRRALIKIKQRLQNAGITLLFDPNDAQMIKTFETAVKSVMDKIVSDRGCSDYKLKVDRDPESIDRLELNATLYVKLNPNLEYINIALVVTPQGFSLTEV